MFCYTVGLFAVLAVGNDLACSGVYALLLLAPSHLLHASQTHAQVACMHMRQAETHTKNHAVRCEKYHNVCVSASGVIGEKPMMALHQASLRAAAFPCPLVVFIALHSSMVKET